ncbi:MAG TPA: SPFH domain-containing protein [Myxococcales bacterium]|jgi:regulator of protease activity HflC (stomatin/prohibitin superfamily)
MVQLAAKAASLRRLTSSAGRLGILLLVVGFLFVLFLGSCTARVEPNEFGVEQHRFGTKTGIGDEVFGPGVYFVGPGTTMHTFPREMHVLDATRDQVESKRRAAAAQIVTKLDQYFANRLELLGTHTYREIEALNIQTSDGYAVNADVTLVYSITNPVKIGKEFGWGSLYVDSFVINTFRNGLLATLGKLNAESFYDEKVRIAAVGEAEAYVRTRFEERGFKVHRLLLRSYHYQDSYEKSLHDKKVAVQLAEKNRKESLVNDERAKFQQIESKGSATITIAESEVNAKISKIKAEADLYSSQVRANADREIGLANAEAKRLKADALNKAGGRYVVALETAKIFDNIQGGVMTPEQYIAFIRSSWALLGLSPGGTAPAEGGAK